MGRRESGGRPGMREAWVPSAREKGLGISLRSPSSAVRGPFRKGLHEDVDRGLNSQVRERSHQGLPRRAMRSPKSAWVRCGPGPRAALQPVVSNGSVRTPRRRRASWGGRWPDATGSSQSPRTCALDGGLRGRSQHGTQSVPRAPKKPSEGVPRPFSGRALRRSRAGDGSGRSACYFGERFSDSRIRRISSSFAKSGGEPIGSAPALIHA